MKKLVAISFLFLIIPIFSWAAMIPGYGGPSAIQDDSRYNCTVWREGMPLPGNGDGAIYNYCNNKANVDINKRFYELEVAVQDLQNQVKTCQQGSSLNTDNDRMRNLESRVSKLESLFSDLQNNIMSGLKSILLVMINKPAK